MKYRQILSVLAIFTIIFTACEPDFSLNAPYRDVTIVYGVLNSNDSINYVKVYKGFQSTGNSIDDAANWNNLYYFDTITVKLIEFKNNAETGRVLLLDTTTAIPKESGIFANPKQLVYFTNERLDYTASYQIKIENKKTGRIVTGMTNIVSPITISAPNIPTNNKLNLINSNLINMPNNGNIRFSYVEEATGYEIFEYFYYFEVNKASGIVTKQGVVKRNITNGNFLTINNVRFGEINQVYNTNSIYDVIALQLKVDPTVDRYIIKEGCIAFEVWGGSESLMKYLLVNQPSSSIVQDRLEYTNLICPTDGEYKTAYGLISSRYNVIKKYNITGKSEDSLVSGSKTKHLGFKKYVDYLPVK